MYWDYSSTKEASGGKKKKNRKNKQK